MKTGAKQPSRVPVNSRDAIAFAVATILAGAASQAGAQAVAAGDDIEEVVVTGFRHSLETSIATKRENIEIVEAVSAEDIGKLPDTSIADSIARLPGLSAQRINGRPSAISIRGLGPDYSTSLLNGRQVVSTSDGRTAEYDQFPSELVNQVVVYKTNDASVVGQGLAGTVDIRPAMPLDSNQRQLAFGLRGERNGNGSVTSTGKGATGDRFSVAYIDQFADHTIGLSLGYAHLDSPGEAKHYEAWQYGDYVGQWGAGAAGVPAVGTGGDHAQFAQGFTANNTATKQVRDGLMAVVQFKPNENFTSTVDLYYSKFVQDTVEHFWTGDIGLWSGGAAFSNVGTSVVDGNTLISSGTVGGAHSLIYGKNHDRTDKISSVGWRNELAIGENWKTMADFGFSHADRNEYYVQSVARAVPDNAFSFSGLDTIDHASWSTTQDLTDPTVVQLTNDPNWAEMRDPHYKDEIKSARLSAKRNVSWGFFSGLDAGLAFNQRDKEVTAQAYSLTLAGTGAALTPIPAGALRGAVNVNVDNINQNILTWDIPSIMGLYTIAPKNPWEAQTNRYQVHEKVTTGYFKLDIDSSMGSVPVKGNLGVQVVRSDQSSDGFAWNDQGGTSGGPANGAVIPVHGGATYTDVLPSLNLVFSLQPDLKLRLGIGKTMARPRMDDMRAGADQPHLQAILNAPSGNPHDPGSWTANGGGEPNLKPWRAEAYDLSLEKYIGKRSYVAVAGFYKHLNTFIYQKTAKRDFSGFPNYDPVLVPGCPIADPTCNPNIGTFTTQDNGSGGKVYGAEFSLSLDGGLITPALDGLGLIASESNTRNSLPKDNNNNPINLDGFSGTVNSFALYYEKGGFSARVSQRYRSAFTATTRGVLLNTENSTHIDAEKQVDAQVGYSFETGALKGLSVLLQGNNLTNQPAIQRQSPQVTGAAGNSRGLLPWKYDDYGRVILLGATYKL
jgi:iron complex outermembrane receptor protein